MRISCFKKTDEDWYGNYRIANDMRHKERYVQVTLLKFPDNSGFRVCVWGNDDLGMELDSTDELYLRQIYSDICLQETVNRDYLEQIGFQYA